MSVTEKAKAIKQKDELNRKAKEEKQQKENPNLY